MASGRLIDYLGSGLASARPVAPTLFTGTVGVYYATDTLAVSYWNGTVWGADGAGTPDPYGLFISKAGGVVAGGYYAERSAIGASTHTTFYAVADGTGTVDVAVWINATKVHGPITLTAGTEVSTTGLSMSVAVGDEVSFELAAPSAGITGVWVRVSA